jgi:hypothetical protein
MSWSLRHALRRARYGKPIVVVSGLPRSGTSMMMQMLSAGGLETLTDELRPADESNPQGYYELEWVKGLEEGEDVDWLKEARGKAVKIIAFLLRYLPEDFNYKVIFMHRELDEVLASQARMLALRGETSDTDDTRMRELFERHLVGTRQMLDARPCVEVLDLSFNEIQVDAARHAGRANRFLGGRLDEVCMAAVVNPQLYRSRLRPSPDVAQSP